MTKIPEQDGVIESAVEPVKNRRKYWLNTTTGKMYILNNSTYELMETEFISNEFGEAIKFQNGILICQGSIACEANQANTTVVFPNAFINNKYVISITNVYSYSRNIVYSIAGAEQDKVNIYPCDAKTGAVSTLAISARYLAIGRWK